jgi:hypothetical protein
MLPVNVLPTHTLTIPSTNQTFKYRPFLVKEEKALLIAQQTEDSVVMFDTIKNVIKACAMSDVDVDKLASFDIEYIFIKLRSVSVSEFAELIFSCDVNHGEDNKKAKQKVAVDLRTVRVDGIEDQPSSKILLFNDVGVCLKYPTVETLKKISQIEDESQFEVLFDIVAECIDYIFTADEVHYAKDQTSEELKSFLNNLTSSQFSLIEQFFAKIPKVKIDVTYTCPVCKIVYSKYLEGISSFF